MPSKVPTRDRMVVSAALLIRERGARATSIDDVLQHSRAPRGSVYHHFPGGRDQLLREATEYAGTYIAGRIEAGAADGPVALFDALVDGYRRELREGDYRAGCPVAAVAIEARADGDATLQQTAADAFDRWLTLLAANLVAAGIAPARAERLAALAVAGIEGGLILAQARRELEPFDAAAAEIRDLIERELTEAA
jgi:AcrR family transcriptional regulator